jgi:nucleoside-diphosphate-sugar epimerase
VNTATNYGRTNNSISSIINTNVMFGLTLLEESINQNIKAFINTDTLLDKNINAYALSKSQLLEWMIFLSNKNTKMINVKIEHMYGAFTSKDLFLYSLIVKLKKNVNEIDFTHATHKRDFIYIDDVVSAYEIIINNIDSFPNYEEFELGSGNNIEFKAFVELIKLQLNEHQDVTTKLNFGAIKHKEKKPKDIKADIFKLKKLGWLPKYDLKDGITKMLNF